MKVLTATQARQTLPELINSVRYSRRPVAIGRRNRAEVLLIQFPEHFNNDLSDITNINQYGGGFEWLQDEPDIYSHADLKRSYV
jgi:hypothetical protein